MKTLELFKKSGWVGLCLVSLLTLGQTRRVDWIHGLGGDAGAWANVANSTGRQITGGTRNTYETGQGIPHFAGEIASHSQTGGANTTAISHSLGGPAVRHVDLGNSNKWSGIITVGSPLRGAQIAVSTRNGLAQVFVARGTTELMRGPSAGSTAAELIQTISCIANVYTSGRVPCLPLGTFLRTFGQLGTLFSADIATLIVREISNRLSLTDQTANDLNPQGSYMQGLIGQGTGTPKIQIWGEETHPVFWRVAGTFTNQLDDEGRHLGDDIAGFYHTMADIEYTTSWIPFYIFRHGYYNSRGHEWMAGATWARNTANSNWQYVIGAAVAQTQQVQVWEYDYSCGQNAQLCDPNDPNCNDADCFNWVWRDVEVYTNEPSDGIVVGTSQRNDGGAWRGHIVRAGGVNHSEMLEWQQMENTFNPVFDGTNTGGQSIFQIGR